MKRIFAHFLIIFILNCSLLADLSPKEVLKKVCEKGNLFKLKNKKKLSFTNDIYNKHGKKKSSRTWTWNIKTDKVYKNKKLASNRKLFNQDLFWLLFPLKIYTDEKINLTLNNKAESPNAKLMCKELIVKYDPSHKEKSNDIYKLYLNKNYTIIELVYLKGGLRSNSISSPWNNYVSAEKISLSEFGYADGGQMHFKNIQLDEDFKLTPIKKAKTRGQLGQPVTIPLFEPEVIPFNETKIKHKLFTLKGMPIALNSLWKNKPTLFVTSSLTCPISRDNCSAVDNLKSQFGKQINIVVVYTTEAHPLGSPSPYSNREWLTNRNVNDKILAPEPTSLKLRIERALNYKRRMKIQANVLVDNMKNSVWKTFGGGPNSGIFVNKYGHIIKRQGWLAPKKMALEIQIYLKGLRSKKIWAKLRKQKYSSWGLEKALLQKDLAKVKTIIAKNPKVLHVGISHDRGNYERNTILHLAINKNLIKHAALFIQSGSKVEAINYQGKTPLHIAASISIEMINLLIKNGSNINVLTLDNMSPMHEALLAGKTRVAKELVNHGAYVDLLAGAGFGDIKAVKRYLAFYKSNPTKLKEMSSKAITFAIINNQQETVKYLLNNGARFGVKVRGFRPLYYAIKYGRLELCHVLFNKNIDTAEKLSSSQYAYNPIHYATIRGKHKILNLLLNHGADPDQLSIDGETALHTATYWGDIKAFNILLKHGASIGALVGSPISRPCGPGDFDHRPKLENVIHLATKYKRVTMLKYLIKKKVSLNLRNRDDKTPLDLAKKNSEIYKILINAGAKSFKKAKDKER